MTKFDQLYQQVTLSEELGEHKPVFASIREILSEHPGRTLGEHPGPGSPAEHPMKSHLMQRSPLYMPWQANSRKEN